MFQILSTMLLRTDTNVLSSRVDSGHCSFSSGFVKKMFQSVQIRFDCGWQFFFDSAYGTNVSSTSFQHRTAVGCSEEQFIASFA